MTPLWFIETRSNDPTAVPQRLAYVCEEMGWPVLHGEYVPFRLEYDFSFLPVDRPVIFYGSINMVKAFRRTPGVEGIRPFAWFDFEEMSCRSYHAHWGRYLLNADYAMYPFGDLPRLADKLYETHGSTGAIFVRPDTNDKVFTGEVVPFERFMTWYTLQSDWGVQPRQLCVVVSPRRIEAEYRLVVADRKVVAASLYKTHGGIEMKEGCPDEVRAKSEEVARATEWQPAPIYCMDMAVCAEGVFVVEIGEVNCAGLYRCDLRTVARAMAEIAEREWQPT